MFPGGMGAPMGGPKTMDQGPEEGTGETELKSCGARNCMNHDGMSGCTLAAISHDDRGTCLDYEPKGGGGKGPGGPGGMPGPGRLGPPPPPALGA